ncbi:MAG: Holliday junction branch migration protein RuvA [Lachnospiraceae bacterium]|nr:Holliday junction branch migration protein RuvA [Lachnospiraceae bacterium]
MYAYLNGIVADVWEDGCVIDVNDIGYNVKISGSTFTKLPGIGERVKLYTYTSVREDAMQLFGFLSRNDLEMFKKLITVNGIGPKGGLALLSVMDADDLRFAIISQDVKAISSAPGIGKKTAERVILDLKDKLEIDAGMIQREMDGCTGVSAKNLENPQIKEAVEALVALGYGQSEASKAVSRVEGADTMESGALLKAALKKLF